jgi:hypothetical protein
VCGGVLTVDGSTKAGELNEEGDDDCGSSELEYSEIERVSLGSPSVDAGGGSETVVWSPVCSLRRKAEAGR